MISKKITITFFLITLIFCKSCFTSQNEHNLKSYSIGTTVFFIAPIISNTSVSPVRIYSSPAQESNSTSSSPLFTPHTILEKIYFVYTAPINNTPKPESSALKTPSPRTTQASQDLQPAYNQNLITTLLYEDKTPQIAHLVKPMSFDKVDIDSEVKQLTTSQI